MIGWNRVRIKESREDWKAREDELVAFDGEWELFEGYVQLAIRSFESFHQVDKYTRYLATIENLRILSESWSEDDGFKVIVSAQAPLALERLLLMVPEVGRVYSNGQKPGHGGFRKRYPELVVEMKATKAALEPVLV